MLYIATLAELKAELDIADDQDDVKLTSLMERLQGRFTDHCQRQFLLANRLERHDGGEMSIFLRSFPVLAIDYVVLDGSTLTPSSDYIYSARRGILYYRLETPWPTGRQIVQVSYTAGYVAAGAEAPVADAEPMPEGLRRAFYMQAAYEWRNRTTMGQMQASAQGVSVNLSPAKLLPDVIDSLSPYCRI